MYDVYESNLAKLTLRAAGNHYGRSELISAEANGELMNLWPQPHIAVNTPDKLEMGVSEVTNGMISQLMLIQEWHDIDRDEALELVEQMKKDQEDLEAANPAFRQVNMPIPPPEDEEGPAGEAAAVNGEVAKAASLDE
jgi:hypothetical protein